MPEREPPAIRHVLHDNHWEMQCPSCDDFVPIDVAVMTGRTAFPAHGAPRCDFADTYNWRAIMPPSGICAMGPLE